MKKKTKKIVLFFVISLVALGVVLCLNNFLNKNKNLPTEGSKNVTINITNKTVEPEVELFKKEIKTEAEYLGDFLKENKDEISLGYEDGQYGMMVHSLMNVNDDYSLNAYWMFDVNGNYSETGADTTVINDGDIINFYIEVYSW